MAPLEITIKASPSDTFKVEVDDEETVEDLSVIVMSLRPDLGEELRLLHKGKFLKDNEVVKALGIQPTDFVAVVGKKKPEAPAQTAAYTPATVAAAAAAALAAPAAAAEDDEAADLAAALAMSQNPGAMAAQAAPPVAPSGQVAAGPDETMVANLCGMGFDRAMVIQALQAAFGNPDRAVEYLFNGIPAAPAQEQQEQQPAAFSGGDMQAVLGPQLLTKAGMQPTAEALKDVDVVMLYFSAHWCPPCRAFTPKLVSAFKYGSPPPNLACVFVSADRDEMAFTQYYNEMPWLAIPYASAGAKSQSLGPAFNVQGIPSLVVLNAKTGAPISLNGRDEVSQMGFNLGACMQRWSQGPAPVAAVAAPTAAPAFEGITIPEEHKKAKKEEPDPGPPPLPIDDAAAKDALDRVLKESWEVQDAFFKTGLKVLNNILSNSAEPKFRTLKRTNAALKAKLLDVGENAGTDLMVLAGFGISSEEALTMSGEPDGRCSEVRNKMKSTHYSCWEKQARKERDEKIKTQMELDKKSGARTMGGEGVSGRNTYGGDRRRGGGGG